MNADPTAALPAPPQPWITNRLLESRIVLIVGEVDNRLAENVTAQLLALAAESNDPIRLFIHSNGGHVESGDTIHDMVRFIGPRVLMIGTGWVASAGTHIYLSVPKQDRFCLPNTRFMIHQPLGGMGGRATEIKIEAEEILRAKDRLIRTIADATGQSVDKVRRDTDHNHWMSPEEAKEYGIVGSVIRTMSELPELKRTSKS